MTVLRAFRVPEDLDRRIRARAAKENRTWTGMVLLLLASALKARKA